MEYQATNQFKQIFKTINKSQNFFFFRQNYREMSPKKIYRF